jgi:hypothetical protein
VNRRLAWLGLAALTLPLGWAVFIYGWQVAAFLTFAVETDQRIPRLAIAFAGLYSLEAAAVCVGWLLAAHGIARGAWRQTGLSLAVALVAAAPFVFSQVTKIYPIL